jgi:Tol biopolymer transport system component
MHQVLTGERPVQQQNDLSLVPLPALRSVNAPAQLVQAVEGFLSANPEKRYRAFQQVQATDSSVTSADISARFYSVHSRRIWAVTATLAAVIATALALWLTTPPVPQPLLSQQVTFSRELKERPLIADRSRLYFQSQGVPAVMEMTGGTIAPLTNLGSEYSIKDVSADGSKVLALKSEGESFEAGRGTIWIASTLGGPPRRLGSLSGQDMRWSPDGQSIAFTNEGAIYTIREDGTNQKKLWEGTGLADSLNYSPNGREISWALIDQTSISREWIMNADGSNPHRMLPDWQPKSDQWFGQWTRDGKHFVFLSFVVDPRNGTTGLGNVYELITPRWFEFWKNPSAALLTVNQLDIQALAPGPDDNSIFVLGMADQGEMKVLDPATGKYVPFLDGLSASDFAISPDKQWMAYSEFPSGNLWKSKLDGSDAVQLTTAIAFMQQWSPDGKSLAYSDAQNIYLISVDGGSPEKLSSACTSEVEPTWRPDGKAIDFMCWDGVTNPKKGIYEIDLATRKVSIRPGTEEYFSPYWSPDGKYLAAMADGPSRMMLYSAATNAWRELKKFDMPPGMGGSWSWSNDSHSIYMRVLEGQPGVYRIGVPDGPWTKVSGLQGLNLKVFDASINMTADDRPALLSHTGFTQIYSLRWGH